MKKSIYLSFTLLLLALTGKSQTIPNAGFEDWTNMGTYSNPTEWSSLNSETDMMSVYTCEKGTPGSPGTAYLKLISKTVTGLGVMPGIAVCGEMDMLTMTGISGFPFTARPENLEGKWQHMIFGASQGYADIQLTRWDAASGTRVTVADGHKNLTGMAMSWASFTVPLSYSDGNYPDTCMITFAASGATPSNNDYLYIDNLSFTGEVVTTGITSSNSNFDMTISPNPASTLLHIAQDNLISGVAEIQITDIMGTILQRTSRSMGTDALNLDISALPAGTYFVKMLAKNDLAVKQFIKL